MALREVKRIAKARPTLEGAGVRLHRAFGFGGGHDLDPFLLLDDFRGESPDDYRAGFPWHPHRGIETVTYVLAGSVEHGDSMGNRGVIGPGDVQWMTAGGGIIHQEMPKGDATGRMYGFQLWLNLPRALKMTPPRYQGVPAGQIPRVEDDDGSVVRVVCGRFQATRGPVEGVAAEPTYLDVTLPPEARKTFAAPAGHHAFAYVFEGAARFCHASGPLAVPTEASGWSDTSPPALAENRTLVVFGEGDEVEVEAGETGTRFLLVHGRPLGEPVAWYGPIVMNTQEELQQAFRELDAGTFLPASGARSK